MTQRHRLCHRVPSVLKFGPLIEDDSLRSPSTSIVNTQVLNLVDEESTDIDYFNTSRQHGEPSDGFDDIHIHPNEPRAVRFTVTAKF